MDGNELRAMQVPIKNRYKSEPKAAFITLKAKGTLDDGNIACKVETVRALAVAGLHPATGGSGFELCSGDMLLEALVACAGVTDRERRRADTGDGPIVDERRIVAIPLEGGPGRRVHTPRRVGGADRRCSAWR